MNTKMNKGIIMTGGTISGAVAAGDNAKAVQYASGAPADERRVELEKVIEELRRQVEANSAQIADAGDVKQALDTLRAEMQRKEPSKVTVRSVLTGVKESLEAVAPLVPLVDTATKLVRQIFG